MQRHIPIGVFLIIFLLLLCVSVINFAHIFRYNDISNKWNMPQAQKQYEVVVALRHHEDCGIFRFAAQFNAVVCIIYQFNACVRVRLGYPVWSWGC